MASRVRQASSWPALLGVLSVLGAGGSAEAQARRVDLQFLVVTGGASDYGTEMVRAGLDEGLVPHTVVDLGAPDRAPLDERFLVDTSVPGVRRARFQAVVLPNQRPVGLSDDELGALARYEREFHVRQLDAYVAPSSAVGMGPTLGSGTLDGATASVTAAGREAAFSYLTGTVPFEDLVPAVHETYGYLAAPLPPENGRAFTSFVEANLPGSDVRGPILGVYVEEGREELALMVAMNPQQLAQQLLFPGILAWLSRGVHLGRERAYLSMHVDDLFLDSGRWSPDQHCTLGEECDESYDNRIIMTPSDVDHLVDWQAREGFSLHLAYNGGAYAEARDVRARLALGESLLRNKDRLRWINHTYTHQYLGCLERTELGCVRDPEGQVRWTPYELIFEEIERNIRFAEAHGLAIDRRELITGQHSGLRRPGREPTDNPNLVRALSALGIAWVGADNSLESAQRAVLERTLTVPRYPMNIYYNCGTKSENVAEYNWFYASRAEGGSGACEASASCQPAVDPRTGFDSVIVPREVRTTLMHAISNDPRPHYAHQSNLAEDRILYPVLEGVLRAYRRLFDPASPLLDLSMTEAGTELRDRASWSAGRERVEAYLQDGQLHLRAEGPSVRVPVTVASTHELLEPYAGTRSGFQDVGEGRSLELPLAPSVGYAQ